MPSSLVCWSDHRDLVAAGLRKLYRSRHHADFEIRCLDQRSFRVHRFVLALFTDFFRDLDGLWAKLDVDPDYVDILLGFLYLGEAVVDYDKMEGFLQLCLRLKIQLFRDVVPKSIAPRCNPERNPVTDPELDPELESERGSYSERYELNDFRLLCPRCFKCFETEKKAKAHKLACLAPASFACRFCPETFRSASILRSHEAVHSDARPFPCQWEGCGKAFKLKNILKEHERREHQKVEYKCSHCPKTYRTRMQVRNHVSSVHSKFRPYTCNRCGTSYATNSLLLMHSKKVHGPDNSRVRKTPIMPRKRNKKPAAGQKDGNKPQKADAEGSGGEGAVLQQEPKVGNMGWFVIKMD